MEPAEEGTGRGKDLSQDVAEDVPWRRRPTASARRQRVTQRVEDVPQLAEDVPHASDGSPERTAAADDAEIDRLASDGTADDDEGFPGGPRDPSILIGFVDHVAHNIWSGQERLDLKLVSHGRKVDKFGRPTAEIEGMIAATGLDPLIRCSVITTDLGLVSAFVERWLRETSSFHLPVGEVTITLDDVSSLLHIPITGALHSFEPLATSDVVALLTELLEVTPDEAIAETCQAGGPHAFGDLGQAGAFSWGAADLVHLYDQLNEASHAPTRQMAGYISLLQCWIYEHFPSVQRSVVDDGYAEASPRACRWLTGKAQMTGIKGAPYRARIDALTVTDVCWMPYAENRGVRGYDLISSYTGQVRWGPIIVYLRPKRVVRQMGYIQTVPPPPVRDSLTGTDIDDRWVHFSDHVAPTGELCVVPGQVAPDYMEWFFQISHPFVTPTEDIVEPRPAPPPPTDDDFFEPPVVEVPVASDPPTTETPHRL
ncbi:protein MAIN-LIKE 1-like [Glycine max]|uniref:protein MAIN-LIKE 1-like n=1 Tax=Glycine max TaxID=3847 RepID=UPI000719189F|nr:protein MAIN-LIKE 1-like [Glycine max]|eukprot:XP_006591632.2 protein MAIN-LIKE 1-like [Glycine max]